MISDNLIKMIHLVLCLGYIYFYMTLVYKVYYGG